MGNNVERDCFDYFQNRTCPVCGKKFTVTSPGEWAYKGYYNEHYKLVCSWSCVRKRERELSKDNPKQYNRPLYD